LFLVVIKDYRPVLGADIISLPVWGGWIMSEKKTSRS